MSVFDDIYNYNSYVFYHILTIMQKIKFELWTQKTRSFYQLIKIITRISFSCFTVSSVIGGIITWWYHKGIIEAKKITFMAFVGICIIFQAIISDIYVYKKRAKIPGTTVAPLTPTTLHASSIVPPTTSWIQNSEKEYFKIKCL